jgi:hypothetical protein
MGERDGAIGLGRWGLPHEGEMCGMGENLY